MFSWIGTINRLVWGVPGILLIVGTGIYLSAVSGFAQLRLFPNAWKTFVGKFRGGKTADGVSPMQALCTALAATVGTGNLVGVAGAISLGGPGAVFWMWICGLLGMVIKFAEATLAVQFRVRDGKNLLAGPMYMISRGLGEKWNFLAWIYSFFGVVAALGVGNATQINAVITGINQMQLLFGMTPNRWGNLLLGIILAVMILLMLLGGSKRIGEMAERLVPFAAVAYLLLGAAVLIIRFDRIPQAFCAILRGAFNPKAVTGGVIGSALVALRTGCARGVFTNEAGMGTAAIAHGSAEVSHPVEQGLLGIMEVFLDTIVICTMTALVILVSGVEIPYGSDGGGILTDQAFACVFGSWVTVILTGCLCCFAFATVLGWGFYGMRCTQYLFGTGAWKAFAWIQAAAVVLSSVLDTGIIWSLAETVNGLMMIPNLIALLLLSPVLRRLMGTYDSLRIGQA